MGFQTQIDQPVYRRRVSYTGWIRAYPAASLPTYIRSFIYDPRAWEDDEPPPVHVTDPGSPRHDFSVPDVATIHTLHVVHLPLPPCDFSALRSKSAHPWRTVRRRNQRLLPHRRPFPQSLPKRIPPPPPPLDPVTLLESQPPSPSLAPSVPIHALVAHAPADDPIPILVLPRPMGLPWDPYKFIPSDCPTLPTSLPGEMVYGPVQSGLALVCAREYPWSLLARSAISEIAWGAHPPDEYDEREDVLDLLPPDQLMFLGVLAEVCRLEPDFTGFVEPAIADFTNTWLDHCWALG
ncbi:hypothetical protein B0H11DRAFT_87341 [Mycena galericulata]|nr:hypothetical protein B0H11DRAFT_87341 [Mycena galericulata]